MSRLRKLALFTALVSVAGGLAAFGGRHHGRMDPEHAKKFATYVVDDVLDDLDADATQRAKVHALKDKRLADFLSMRDEHTAVRGEALALWDAADPDAAKVHALVDARVDAFRKLAHGLADDALELHRTLTPEQRAALSAEMKERAARFDPPAK